MNRNSFAFLFLAEIFSSVIGFGVMITLARRLGPESYADFEYGAAIAAWWLVLVRGGFDAIVYREAARRPRLVGPLTEALIGLRLVSAFVGLAVIFSWSVFLGSDRGRVVAVAGLVLIPSALAFDVGLRSSCRFGWLAVVQAIRALGLALAVGLFVSGATDAWLAAGSVVLAEVAATILLISIHWLEYGSIGRRIRPRVWVSLARRGMIAGATRFARVSLYAADLLIVAGLASATELGPFAAARRVAFAVLAIGLVVPSAMGPRFARAWLAGSDEARIMITLTFERMCLILLPATIGLMMTAHRWMPILFGEAFREGGPWLVLVAARLPFVLASNIQQSALIACRREAWALRLLVGMVVLALVVIPALASWKGTWGVAWGFLAIEACGSLAGWFALARLGVAPRWSHANRAVWMGCLALILICAIGQQWPLGIVVVAGVCAYGMVVVLLGDRSWVSTSGTSKTHSLTVAGGPVA